MYWQYSKNRAGLILNARLVLKEVGEALLDNRCNLIEPPAEDIHFLNGGPNDLWVLLLYECTAKAQRKIKLQALTR